MDTKTILKIISKGVTQFVFHIMCGHEPIGIKDIYFLPFNPLSSQTTCFQKTGTTFISVTRKGSFSAHTTTSLI